MIADTAATGSTRRRTCSAGEPTNARMKPIQPDGISTTARYLILSASSFVA